MTVKHFLPALAAALTLCLSCVDPGYQLGTIETEGTVLRNLEVPVGNFEPITLATMLKAPGSTLLPLPIPGAYQLNGSAEISGVSFELDESVYFKEAELHTVILNTLPLDLRFSVTALDSEGNPCQDVTVTATADKDPMIASGRAGSPTENPVVIRLSCKQRYMTLDGLRLVFSGQTGSGFVGTEPQMSEGITLTKVYLKMPEGLKVEL